MLSISFIFVGFEEDTAVTTTPVSRKRKGSNKTDEFEQLRAELAEQRELPAQLDAVRPPPLLHLDREARRRDAQGTKRRREGEPVLLGHLPVRLVLVARRDARHVRHAHARGLALGEDVVGVGKKARAELANTCARCGGGAATAAAGDVVLVAAASGAACHVAACVAAAWEVSR